MLQISNQNKLLPYFDNQLSKYKCKIEYKDYDLN